MFKFMIPVENIVRWNVYYSNKNTFIENNVKHFQSEKEALDYINNTILGEKKTDYFDVYITVETWHKRVLAP